MTSLVTAVDCWLTQCTHTLVLVLVLVHIHTHTNTPNILMDAVIHHLLVVLKEAKSVM